MKHPVALGWICLTLGVVTMCVSLWLFAVYGLLYLGALVLAVVAMRRQRVFAGIALLLVPTSLWVMLTVYRGATALDHGVTRAQNRVARSIEESRQQEEQTMAAQAAGAARSHRTDPALGVWAVTMWDEQGAVLQNSDPLGGFESCDGEAVRFSIPVDQRRWRYRVFAITGGGNRGEWHDEPASGWAGWFEIRSRADIKAAPAIDFTWNDTPDNGGAPRRGVFTRH